VNFRQLTAPVTLVAAAALLITGGLIAFFGARYESNQKIKEVGVQAGIVASIIPAALDFNYQDETLEYLNGLRANSEIRSAAIYDENNDLFVSFSRAEEWAPPARLEQTETSAVGGEIFVTAPVMLDGSQIGVVRLRSIAEPFVGQLVRYGGIFLLFVMGALVLMVTAASNRALATANAELREQTRQLAETNEELSRQSAEREKAEAVLRQVQKMETIGQLTGGVAHDFNNLLTIVLGNLERLRRRLEDGAKPSQVLAAVDSATHGAERAAGLTKSLLAFARRQPLNPAPIDANRLVSSISDLLRRTLGEKIVIEGVVGGGLWKTLADPNQLENAILNLALNARDAMPNGGKLTIETANAYLDENYVRQNEDVSPGQYVMLAITDTGCGMTREIAERAFEPFFTTKESGYGTGLGLSQVYGFVKQSGGHIKVYSEVGEGTTIRIYLPRLVGEAEHALVERKDWTPPHGDARTTVLVVEDDPEVRAHTVQLVEELGYSTLAAASGPEALRTLDENASIAILFTDVGLPDGMNGRQLAEAALRLRPDLRVLYTTGYARNAIVHEGRLDPGVRLVTKPFTYASVGRALAEALGETTAQPTILLVEDEVLIRMNVANDLRDMGFAVLEAGDARSALKLIGEAKEKISAAIVDVGLPEVRGDVLAADIRAMKPDMLIVIATGYADGTMRARFAADARVKFLDKPYLHDALASTLAEAGVRAPKIGLAISGVRVPSH
jgi:signal transduction histidine kinase/DNA-binding response OmpR family regulator